MIQCSQCGKFRKNEDVIEVGGEYDEWWTECRHCCSKIDLETYLTGQKKNPQRKAASDER